MSSESSGLGSLSQAARFKQLNTARAILIFIGVLTALVNGYFYFTVEQQIDDALQKEVRKVQSKGMYVDQGKLAEIRATAIQVGHWIIGATIGLGVVFIFLGMLVKTRPVPVTILGLVLYVGAAIVFGMLDPMNLVRGWLIKLLIVIGLVKSIQSAIAYQKEVDAQEEQAFASPVGEETV